MLMMLGPVQFEVIPFNTSTYGHDHTAGFAEKPVLGTRPPLEFVGEPERVLSNFVLGYTHLPVVLHAKQA